MSLYYFHVRTDHGLAENEEGIDLPHLQAVINEALPSAAEFSAEAEGSGSLAFEVWMSMDRSCCACLCVIWQ